MKKIFFVCLAAALHFLTIHLSAQNNMAQKSTLIKDTIHLKDYVTMKSGKMMSMKNGRMKPIKKEIIMKNGTKVTPDGKITLTGNTSYIMKEGDIINIEGELSINQGMH